VKISTLFGIKKSAGGANASQALKCLSDIYTSLESVLSQ